METGSRSRTTGGLDFLAVVSRPDFPTGSGPAGDCFGFRRLLDRHPEWRAAVLELNSKTTSAAFDGSSLVLSQDGSEPFAVDQVSVAVYLPICLEVEETLLCRIDPSDRWSRFATEQWRPITAWFEDRLDRLPGCLNRPSNVRAANNKLLQLDRLKQAGLPLPHTELSIGWPENGSLGASASLVAKNVSEGGWKSPTEFSPARLLSPDDRTEPWPSLWQRPIPAARELRCWVLGESVEAIELDRDPAVLDVRESNGGYPSARPVELPAPWIQQLLATTAALGLAYAVIDALPVHDELHILEVNANGVWWFLPDVAEHLERRFHQWIETAVGAARTTRPL